jgi:hypothetical protein
VTKLCRTCNVVKSFEFFNVKKANKDGLSHKCKVCRSLYRRGKTPPAFKPPPKILPQFSPTLPPSSHFTDSQVCYQKLRRQLTEQEDRELGYPFDLLASDFTYSYEKMTKEHIRFIERYEWLGKIGWAVKWCFTARYEEKLAGVVMMSEPTMATKHKKYEVLIQRGAASSWAPPNLNSKLVMFACRWMVANTEKRLFTCYSDPAAGEIGTIYQACNFLYLGRGWGVKKGVKLPSGKIVSKRDFSKTSAMKKWAKELGISWDKAWCKPNGYQDLAAYPKDVLKQLQDRANLEATKYPEATQESKGKYALILGKDRREEKQLKKEIVFKIFPYPKR